MNNAEREFFISRICAGYIKCPVMGYNFRIYPISDSIAYESNELVIEIMESTFGLTEDEMLIFLTENNEWDLTKEGRFIELPKLIEDKKVEMFNCTFKSSTREELRKSLNILRKEFDELNNIRSKYNYLTTLGIALSAKSYYIVENSTYLDGKLYDWNDVPVLAVMSKYNSLLLDETKLRELARTEPWTSIWSIKKANGKIFDEPFTFEQKQLILYSKFYDSIQEAYERPSQEVIDDDDLLDGWLISNRRKHSTGQNDSFTTNSKIAGAEEVFIMAETSKDVEKVNNMNDPYANSIKKRRMKQLEQKGQMSWLEFSDMKENIGIEQARLMREKFK